MSSPYDRGQYEPLQEFAFETLTVDNTAAGIPFTAATMQPGGKRTAIAAFCSVETAPIRFRGDGTAPTATVGMLLNVGDTFVVWGTEDLNNAKFIRTTGTSGTVTVRYSH